MNPVLMRKGSHSPVLHPAWSCCRCLPLYPWRENCKSLITPPCTRFALTLPSPCAVVRKTCETREAAPGLGHMHSNPGHFAACKAEAFVSPPPDRARRFHKLIEDESFLRNVGRIARVSDFWFATCRLRHYRRGCLPGVCPHLQPGDPIWK